MDQSLLDCWRDYFPPQPLWSWKALRFLVEGFLKVFDDPVQLLSSTGAVICALGCIKLARKNSLLFWLLSAPLLATALAGILHRYPWAAGSPVCASDFVSHDRRGSDGDS
jgi:hypothetical protein